VAFLLWVVPRHHTNKNAATARRHQAPSVIAIMAESNPHYKKEYKALEGEKRASLKKVKGTTKGKKAKDEAALYVASLLLVRSSLRSLLRSLLRPIRANNCISAENSSGA
jgi:hypothetical protein